MLETGRRTHRSGGRPGAQPARGLVAALLALIALAAPDARAETLRVGTAGDYPPFSAWGTAPDAAPTGLGPDLVRAWARDRGLEIRFVRFRWPDLLDDLAAERFDLAVGGITVRPERSIAGRFSVPVATSGAVVLVAVDSPVRTLPDLAGLRVAVNAGGHLERVARSRLAGAHVVPIPDNAAVLGALRDGRADAVVTDTREAPHWQARAGGGTRVLGPFTRDRKALLLRPELGERAADLDTWLMAREADGTLARLRALHLSDTTETATPLAALLAAMDERLALMPAVAEAKRATGAPVDVPDRERAVLDAAIESARRAHARSAASGAPPGPLDPARTEALRALFRAQIEAAKQIQRRTLAGPPPPDTGGAPDLDTALRPALVRIGDRVTRLALGLPGDLSPETIREAVRRELAQPGLRDEDLEAIATAIGALAASAPAGGDPEPSGNATRPGDGSLVRAR